MKDKIILFVIGVLVGAVIATGAFYIYTTTNKNCNNNQMNGNPPEMPNSQNSGNNFPTEKPDGVNGWPQMPNNSMKG